MADEKTTDIKGTIAGWIKAGVTSVVGLVSGALLMYATPLINSTIKPSKPVANFAAQPAGLTVTFTNHSTGGVDGWWDFGDGTVLEPFSPRRPAVTHQYDKPGTYSVKLSLSNLVGEGNDRTVSVTIDGTSGTTTPEISQFEITPVTPQECAPAVYRLQSKVKNATLCLLSLGDERPSQLDADSANQERYITFAETGCYTIRLAALNGKTIVEKTQTVYVGGNDGRDPLAKLQVSYEAAQLERVERLFHIPCVWQREGKETVSPIQAERMVSRSGFVIKSAEIANKDEKNAPVRKLSLTVAPDKKAFSLNGELVRSSSWLGTKTAPSWVAEVKVVMERRSAPVVINRGDVMMAAPLNSTTKIPLQPLEEGWEVIRKQVNLEVYDAARRVWASNQQQAPGATVMLKNQACRVSVTPQHDHMLLRIETVSALPAAPTGPAFPSLPQTKTSVLAPVPLPAPLKLNTPALPPIIQPAGFDRLPPLPPGPKGPG